MAEVSQTEYWQIGPGWRLGKWGVGLEPTGELPPFGWYLEQVTLAL